MCLCEGHSGTHRRFAAGAGPRRVPHEAAAGPSIPLRGHPQDTGGSSRRPRRTDHDAKLDIVALHVAYVVAARRSPRESSGRVRPQCIKLHLRQSQCELGLAQGMLAVANTSVEHVHLRSVLLLDRQLAELGVGALQLLLVVR